MMRWYKDHNAPLLVLGPPGIGKSDAVKQVSVAASDEYFYDLRLSLLDPTDLAGLPFIADITGPQGRVAKQVSFGRPHWMPPTGFNGRATVVLEEINTAPIAVQNAALQPLKAANGTDRMIGSHRLSDHLWFCANGNRLEDVAHVHQLGEPIRDRFHIETIDAPDFNSWIAWAHTNNVHPRVIGFITWKKDALFQKAENEYSSPTTPRGWAEKISPLVGVGVRDRQVFQRAIGADAALQFAKYLAEVDKMPKIDDLLSGKITWDFNKPGMLSIHYTILLDLAERVKAKHSVLPAATKVAATASAEWAAIYMTSVIKADRERYPNLLTKVRGDKHIREWIKNNMDKWKTISR